VEFDDGFVKTKCDQCREMWAERNERGISGEPPCDQCRVECLPANVDAQNIFRIVRGQLIMGGMGGVVDINHIAIHEAMRLYRVKDRKKCFEKVLILAGWWIKKLNKK
jgi:hypothetical protein